MARSAGPWHTHCTLHELNAVRHGRLARGVHTLEIGTLLVLPHTPLHTPLVQE